MMLQIQDGSGRISFKEVQDFVNTVGKGLDPSQLKGIFADFDWNSDGLICLKEFCTFFSPLSRSFNNAAFNEFAKDMLA